LTLAFDADALQRSYAFLDDCPEAFLAALVALPVGSLQDRVRGFRVWRDALLQGHLPGEDTWPPREVSRPVRRALTDLNIVRFCKGNAELCDELMHSILAAFSSRKARFDDDISIRLRELEQLERHRLEAEASERKWRRGRRKRNHQLDAETVERLRRQAAQEVGTSDSTADPSLLDAWGERARAWSSIADVFGDLGELMGRGWDMSLGVLKHTGWQDLLRLRQLIERLPQVREIVQSLGRLQSSENEETVAETVFAPVRRLEEERREVRSPRVPTEARGIERSGDISRMLPVEAAYLAHPKLRYLWHARRADQALLTYEFEGIEFERHIVERDAMHAVEQRIPRQVRGPVIAVMDTSGSMHGLPERVAKALVLEALRTAHAEQRRCFLYAYSGPGQISELELNLTAEGVGRLLDFLAMSFGGGNDEAGVLERVVARLSANDWRKADVVFVSDGEWPAPTRLLQAVQRARENGTRFHGVQIGNRGQSGLHAVCDPVHVFRDWLAAGGHAG
jgi:uncharacterized protein with von Willebrand factor type A (vWA) domain